VTELRFTEAASTPHSSQIVNSVPAEDWARLQITPRRTHGSADWIVRAGNLVGIADVSSPTERITIQIEPKLPDADIFMLADWAYGQSPDLITTTDRTAHIAMLRTEPTASLLAWYLHSLEAFAVRWMRRSTAIREETLVGRVKGSIDMTTYMRRSVSRAAPHRIPCRFSDTTRDTLPNRLLLAALHHVSAAIPAVRTLEARRYLSGLANRIEPLFAGITSHRPAPADFKRIRLAGSQRHYKTILEQTKLILDDTYFSNAIGTHQQISFLWRAHAMYEQALGNILATNTTWRLETERNSIRLSKPAGGTRVGGVVNPDYVLRRGSDTFLLDAKWKDAFPTQVDADDIELAVTDDMKIRVKRPDIYQMVAYARFHTYTPARIGLVYPVTLKDGEQLPTPRRITGFDQPVHVLFCDVGTNATANMAALVDQIDDAWHYAHAA
jgi:5-methylcytosine-specific restriction enzyme subunit McrC